MRSELLPARQMVPHTLQIAEAVKEQKPLLFMLAHSAAADVDEDFENYDSALEHMTIVREVANKDIVTPQNAIVLKANYGRVLRKLKRFDEAERLYLGLIYQTTKDSSGLSQFDLFCIRFSLAITYAEKGEFDKYLKALPDGAGRQVDEDERLFAERIAKMDAAAVNCSVLAGSLERAEKDANHAIDWAQQYFGVSSLRYVEATELLSKVRIAQDKNDDATVLLKKSADIRAGLLGKDHPSVARVQKEIDAIRKKQLAKAEPIWTPIDNGANSKATDRYGKATPGDGAVK
jgi:tetratricopeptide (TPR) repeat protein